MFNGNSAYGNGASVCASNGNSFADERMVRSMPWLWRVQVPGMVGGWPR